METEPTRNASDELLAAHGRWCAIAKRLRLSEDARGLGAVVLKVDATSSGNGGALTRARLIGAATSLDASAALVALQELEEAGVLEAAEEDAAWIGVRLMLARPVRWACFGLLPRERRRGVAREVLPRVAAALDRVLAASRSAPVLCALVGAPGAGRDVILETLLARFGQDGLVRIPAALLAPDPLEPETSGLVPVWDARGIDPSPEDRQRGATFLSRGGPLAVALLDRDDEVPRAPGRASHVVICDPLDAAEHRWVWRHALGGDVALSVRELRVGMGLAHESASIARARGVIHAQTAHDTRAAVDARALDGRALEAEPQGVVDDVRAVDAPARANLRAVVDAPARAVDPRALVDTRHLREIVEQLLSPASRRGIEVEHPTLGLHDVVLPEVPRRGLAHALTLARMSEAFGERRGVKILLSGAPGTGKTLSARALAAELGRSLYRIDLATVVSKWLGETEKNLRHAFLAARAVGAVLLFDEGEALMGQRGDVARGSDRYANLEVAYLLQALEAHDGVVVVTTNARGKMDGAFMRRFDVVLELPRPDAVAREALWRRELGQAADSLAEGFLSDVARRVELTGGHIAAAARLAHAAAHADAHPLAEEDVLEAIAFEHDKLGGSMTAARFREEASKAGAKWRSG